MRILAALLCLLAAPAGADTRTLTFDVMREGTPIGTHRVSIGADGPRTDVTIEIDLEVRFAFLTLYRYTHRARETWIGADLVSLDATTDDNGTPTRVAARAVAGGLSVEGSGGSYVAPAGTYPTSYWKRDKVRQTRLLDTQSGKLVAVRNAGTRVRVAAVDGTEQPVEVHRIDGELVAEVGYAADGSWATLAFEARGARIGYVRRGAGGG
ncbi:MAG: hypothetical protein JNL71_01795 [Rhodospirillales bacterium]|nr:hypothetical protein [Rhodospirillales bacterium]